MMTGQHMDGQMPQAGTAIRRRGLVAGAAALVAGIMAKQAALPVSAFTGNHDGQALIIGANIATGTANSSATTTQLSISAGGGDGFSVLNSNGAGIYGQSDNFYGVYALSKAATGTGIYGQAIGSSGIGVFGLSDQLMAIGVEGRSNLGVGVFGTSNGNAGVLGTTTAPGNAGLGGIVNVAGTAAFAGTSTNPSAFAGFFTGDVFVNGNFTVNDPTKKHGAIQHPDGSLRLLYSMESPESWLEDFGKGQLVSGQAVVSLDPDFAAVIQTDDYHVFLTPRDAGSNGLAVVAQAPSGFTVQELRGGTSNGAFSYRLVAKPKTTNKVTRLAKFTVPDIKVSLPPMASGPTAQSPGGSPQAAPPSRPAPSASASSQGSGTTGATVPPAPPPRP